MVEEAAVAFRRQEAERDPANDREEHRSERQLDRRREALPELLRHRPPRGDRVAELEPHDAAEVVEVLDVHRLVQTKLLVDRRDRLRRGALAEQRRRGGPGQRPEPEEDQERQPDQDRDQEQEPADDETQHVARRTLAFLPLLLDRDRREQLVRRRTCDVALDARIEREGGPGVRVRDAWELGHDLVVGILVQRLALRLVRLDLCVVQELLDFG
jgi:hypothetical protein